MTKQISEIQSSSNPGKSYPIYQGDDGVIYCTCWQWKKARTCKHLEKYLAMSGKTVDGHGGIELVIEEVVAQLKGINL